ncbi:Uncharacterised protein [Legionella feeleii]|uniref:Uncharacterized protein n=1 Tax=Legionella feeleii TaxID=453 RepID=A0A378KKN5_9GAMM|nr:Uncharacterised protein [Legionella feeleii]
MGVGIEENAGTGTYDAIIQFNDYYSKLDEVSKEKIPPAVKQEIDLLLTLSSDSTKNIKATSQIETCIKIRRESLVAAITPQEQVLSEIGLTKKTAETLCAEKKAQLLSCQNELKIAIEKKKYQGIDKRGLTLELFKTLQVDIAISSAADLQEIVKLSPSELDSLFKNIALQKQFVDQFESLEMLVLFIHQTPIPKLQVLLKHCGQSLANKFILKPGDLSVLLISLDAERVSLIISMMMGKIKNAYDFVDLIENLSLEQSLLVCNALKEKLHDIIKTVSDFKYILVSLSSEQGALVFELIEHQLLNLIKTGEDFGIALAALAPEQHVLLFKAIKHKLPDLINTAIDFTCVVNYLYLEEMSFVFEAIKDRLPKLITNARDFHRILKNPFSKEQGAFILKIVEDKLPELVNTLADFELVVNYLSPEQIVFLCQGISKISVVINDIHDFKHLLKAASLEQFYPLCKTLMDKAPWLLRTGDDFCELITISPQEKQAFIFDLIKDKLPEIINDAHHVKIALRHLSLTQRAVLLALMKEKWVAIIKTADDFSDLLEFLSLEEKTDLFDLMKKRLPNLIKTARDYVNITEYLSSEQNSTILGLMQDKLPAIIEKVDDFIAVTACTESHDFLFKVMKSEFAFLIKNSKELNKLMNALSEEERIDLCKYELPLCRVIVNVGRDVPKITDLFQTPEGKRHFQHSYFKSLLAEIELDNNLKIQKSNLFCLQKNVASYFADKIPLSDFKEGVLMVIKELTEYSGKENYRPVILSKWKSAIITLEKTGAEVSPVDKLKNSKYDFQFFQSPKNTVAEELIPESTDRDEYGFHNSQ